jgi:hypothetical protein
MTTPIPVVAGRGEQCADRGPSPLVQRGARGNEFGVVERGVEGLGRALAAAAEGRRGW